MGVRRAEAALEAVGVRAKDMVVGEDVVVAHAFDGLGVIADDGGVIADF